MQKTAEHMDFRKVKRSLFYVEQLYDEKGTRNTLLITSKALWRFHDFHSISA